MATLFPALRPVAVATPPQFAEPSLCYAPPYETPAHEEFAWHVIKVLDPDCGLAAQMPLVTDAGPVWVDFVVEAMLPDGRMRRVGFELTGADEDEAAAALRDAVLAQSHALDALYRFPAAAVLTRVADVLLLVAGFEPSLFSLRGRTNLERLASPEALLTLVHPSQAVVVLDPAPPSCNDADVFEDAPVAPAPLRLVRRSAVHALTWEADYARAATAFGLVPLRRAA
ncbi:MAG: hypothetical protein IAE99_00995 [Rhodothermales bacterium]|nr:hypothetical protein [Rhodothermales bacterium]MCA0269744.1 hypothetical protein [Bacteroidota bacterium]